MNAEQKNTAVITEALQLKEQGMEVSAIVAKFPDYVQELRGIFAVTSAMDEQKNNILPSPELLKIILQNSRLISSTPETLKDRFHTISAHLKLFASLAFATVLVIVLVVIDQSSTPTFVATNLNKTLIQEAATEQSLVSTPAPHNNNVTPNSPENNIDLLNENDLQ